MTDIVKRLRARVSDDECWHNAREAADEIERLRMIVHLAYSDLSHEEMKEMARLILSTLPKLDELREALKDD